MKLTLLINGEEKTFTAPFVSGRMLKNTLIFQKSFDPKNLDAAALDKMVDYVVDLFGKQFTQDQFYDGIASNKIYTTVADCVVQVNEGANEATKDLQDPNE